jgi:hypothetical protein
MNLNQSLMKVNYSGHILKKKICFNNLPELKESICLLNIYLAYFYFYISLIRLISITKCSSQSHIKQRTSNET